MNKVGVGRRGIPKSATELRAAPALPMGWATGPSPHMMVCSGARLC
ncbi:hypothetical protein [Ruegeria sp. 6PALISEP08]|nr:hypothetical protein [Ruegeria sp. 6PALISEP08]